MALPIADHQTPCRHWRVRHWSGTPRFSGRKPILMRGLLLCETTTARNLPQKAPDTVHALVLRSSSQSCLNYGDVQRSSRYRTFSDQLHLPVPDAKFETVVVKPEIQQDMVQALSERVAEVHTAVLLDPSVDNNMFKITSDGCKIGLDQRLMNSARPMTPTAS